jgi:hypothetical protein
VDAFGEQIEMATRRAQRVLHIVREATHQARAALGHALEQLASMLRLAAEPVRFLQGAGHLAAQPPLFPREPADRDRGRERDQAQRGGQTARAP